MHTLIHTHEGNLERPIYLTVMFLDSGRKPEYPVRTHVCTGRTCRLHAERPLARSQTLDLLAARQQCYQLRHRAAVYILKTVLHSISINNQKYLKTKTIN
ncbi:hypothetical protein ATANTOWER_005140 [Ataeniobius toweri]|uniref:Uncharacterized protein n=1 Tax=Ataeniobius toweri TaxID=208326 RepID=A0ABU7A5D4_9TELE|nr:hypothetical protein [Ataeniobius toweri]